MSGAFCARFARVLCAFLLAVISVNLFAPSPLPVGRRGSNTRMNCNEEINIDNCPSGNMAPPHATPPLLLLVVLSCLPEVACMKFMRRQRQRRRRCSAACSMRMRPQRSVACHTHPPPSAKPSHPLEGVVGLKLPEKRRKCEAEMAT